METKVQVISEEFLKPSSQTPHHLRSHKPSLLDQFMPPIYVPLVFFYQAEEINDTAKRAQMSQKLKRSLSETLATFYPLAGKLDEKNFRVDCNDAGVKYIEARVHARVSDVIQDPNLEQMKKYLPVLAASPSTDDPVTLAVQINFFDCGGVAVGVCLWHGVADGESLVTFMNSWAATCRGEGDKLPRPNFDSASDHFPATELPDMVKILLSSRKVKGEKFVTARFVFDKEKLNALKAVVTSSGSYDLKDPTRVELVSAFLWRYFIKIAKPGKPNPCFAAGQAVNLRRRTVPPHFLEHVFGNCIVNQVAIFDKGAVPELQDLVHELRKAIRVVDDEYIRESQLEKTFGPRSRGDLELCGFSSWCRFPVYEVDYGWGKPVWIGSKTFPIKNFAILSDTRSGDGVEAWINTLHEDVETLESYFKLISPSAELDANANSSKA